MGPGSKLHDLFDTIRVGSKLKAISNKYDLFLISKRVYPFVSLALECCDSAIVSVALECCDSWIGGWGRVFDGVDERCCYEYLMVCILY